MSRPKPEPVSINNEEELKLAISMSYKKFVVLDIHQDWCGPTLAVMPFFNQVNIQKYIIERNLFDNDIITGMDRCR